MADLTGRRLGKYELVERLGRGGMAEVYKAYQPGMDRFVAVKVMHSHLAETDDFVSRFKREAQLVGQLRHPHIVQVIDFDVEDDVYYMVMEYIKGETLKYYIQQKGAIPADEALRIASRLSDALSYAHQQNMIHRDIKPANVMFTDLTFTHPVLTDFGIARIISGETQLTASGAFVGTPAYISPESARGQPVDERADIYSMGIMLYEMIAGKVPYDADTPFAVIMKHVNDPLPSPRQFNIKVTDSVERVLFTALAKNPDERYQTAGELRDALNDALAALAVERPTQHSLENRTREDLEATLATTPDQDEMATITYDGSSAVAGRPAPTLRIPQIATAVIVLAVLAGAAIFGLGLLDSDNDNGDDNDVVEVEGTDESDALAVNIANADEQFELGNYSDAITAYTVLLGDFPEEASLLQKRGRAFYAVGEYDNALEDFEAAINIDDTLAGIRGDRAAALIEIGDFENAIEDLGRAIEENAENAELYLVRARAHRGMGQIELAKDDLEQAIAIDPTFAQAFAILGEIYLDAGDTARATDNLTQASSLDPANATARVGLARLYADDGNYIGAINELDLAIEANPQFAEAYAERGFARMAMEEFSSALSDFNSAIRNDDTLSRAHLGRGLIEFELGNYEDAIDDLSVAIEETPTAEAHLRRAQSYIETNDSEAALADFQAAVELDPELTEAHLGAARIEEENGNSENAIASYSEVLTREPDNQEALVSRAWLYSDNEQYEEARPDFEAYLALNDQDAEAFLGLGDTYLVDEDYELAIQNYDRALDLDDTLAYAYLNRGYAHSAISDYEAALDDFTLALENDIEEETEVYYERGFAQKELGNDEEAIQDFTQALNDDDSLVELYVARGQSRVNIGDYEAALTDFAAALENGYEDEAEIRRYRGIAQAETGNYEAALEDLNAVLEEEPGDLDMLFYSAVSNVALEDYDGAIDTLTDIIERDYEKLGDAYMQRGIAQLALGETNAAIRDFTQAIQQDATLAEAYYRRGLAHRDLSNNEDAVADFTRAIELDDTFGAAYYYRGEIYLNQSDYETAIADFDLAIQYGFDEIYKAYLDRGFAYSNIGNPDEAIRNYTQAIEAQPDYARAYNNRGIIYFDQGDFERAIENFDKAIEFEHFDLAAVYYNRGLSKYNLGDFEGSIEDFNTALEIDDTYASAYYARGNSYYDLDDYATSIKDFTSAIENNYSPLENAYLNRGLSASSNGNYEDAVADYTRAIEINDTYALAYNNRAVAELELGDFEAAIADYERALELDYDSVHWVYHGLARANLGLGNPEVAFDYANQALDALSDFADALRLRAQIQIELGNNTAALTDYNSLIVGGNGTADDYFQRGQLLFAENEFEAAVDDFDRVILLDVDLVDAYVLRASAFLGLGDPESAKTDLQRALQFDSANANVREILGDIYFDEGELELALENYNAYVDLVGTSASLRVLNRIGQIEESLSPDTPAPSEDDETTVDEPETGETPVIATDGELIRLNYAFTVESDSIAVVSRERTLLEIANNEGVEVALEELNTMDIDTAALLALRGELNIYAGNAEQGLADADAAIEQEPNHPAGYLVRALYYSTVEFNEEEMVNAANRAVEVAPENGLVRLVYANIMRDLRRYEEAINAYNQAEELGAPILNVFMERSQAFEEMGDYQGIIDNLVPFIAAQPEAFPFERMRLAGAYILQGDTGAAYETVEAQISYGDEDPSYYADAAYVAYRDGNFEQARAWARNALALEDDIPAANYVLALVARDEEDFALAVEQFEIVRSFDEETWRYEYPFLNPLFGHQVMVDQARLLARQGNVDDAIALLTEAINEGYENLFYQARGELYLEQGLQQLATNDFIAALSTTGEPVRVQSIVDVIRAQGEDHVFEAALTMIERSDLENIPVLIEGLESPRFDALRGFVLIVGDQPEPARELAQSMLDADENNPYGYLLMAAYFDYVDDSEQFMENIQRAYEVGPDEPYVVLETARVLRDQGEHERATELYHRAEELGVSPYRLLPERARYFYDTDRFSDAIADFERFGELPDAIPYWEDVYLWAGSYVLDGQPEAAANVVERFVDIPAPDWAQASYFANLAYIGYRAENADLVAGLLDRAEAIDASEPHVRYLRALIATRDGDFETALAIFGELRGVEEWRYEFPYLNPRYGHMLLLDEARVFLGFENYQEALPRLAEAIEQRGDFVELYLIRADVYLALGNPDAAIEDLRTAFEVTQDEDLRNMIRDRLTELTGGE